MAQIFAANSSGILIDNEPVEGVRTIDYQVSRTQGDVHAVGSAERIAVYYGPSRVEARLRIASNSTKLDGLLASGALFQVVANLRHGEAAHSVAFDDCFMLGKEFAMAAGQHGEAVYSFSATRVREEDQPAAAAAP